MKKTGEEMALLAKLASRALDGMVGDERVYRGYRNVYCGKYIKNVGEQFTLLYERIVPMTGDLDSKDNI